MMNRIDLEGRVAVITGGPGGIGSATAQRLAASGAVPVFWDMDKAALARSLEQGLARDGMEVDVTDQQAVETATRLTIERHGRIDILVNGAGIVGQRTRLTEYPVDLWRRVVDINLHGTFLCCRAVVPHMQRQGSGRIVNIASVSGKEGNPLSSAYSAAKAGVLALTKALGKELAKEGILVNCIAPAIIATQRLFHDLAPEDKALFVSRVPMGRPGRPEEAAAMIAWLCSDDCSFTTGAAFDLTGGRATY
jgi:2-dehydro-3-deoxy-L-rhamnonate dehydrogenase (NAD+)